MKEKNIKKLLTYNLFFPGWGHIYWGLRRKGFLLIFLTLLSIGLLIWGGILYARFQLNPPEEEVKMDEMGRVIEEETASPFPWGATLASLGGILILTWAGIYGIRDARRIIKAKKIEKEAPTRNPE